MIGTTRPLDEETRHTHVVGTPRLIATTSQGDASLTPPSLATACGLSATRFAVQAHPLATQVAVDNIISVKVWEMAGAARPKKLFVSGNERFVMSEFRLQLRHAGALHCHARHGGYVPLNGTWSAGPLSGHGVFSFGLLIQGPASLADNVHRSGVVRFRAQLVHVRGRLVALRSGHNVKHVGVGGPLLHTKTADVRPVLAKHKRSRAQPPQSVQNCCASGCQQQTLNAHPGKTENGNRSGGSRVF